MIGKEMPCEIPKAPPWNKKIKGNLSYVNAVAISERKVKIPPIASMFYEESSVSMWL